MSDNDGSDIESPMPTPPARPRIPYQRIIQGDISFDKLLSEYVTSPKVHDRSEDTEHSLNASTLHDANWVKNRLLYNCLCYSCCLQSLNIPKDRVREALETPPSKRSKTQVKALVEELQRQTSFSSQVSTSASPSVAVPSD